MEQSLHCSVYVFLKRYTPNYIWFFYSNITILALYFDFNDFLVIIFDPNIHLMKSLKFEDDISFVCYFQVHQCEGYLFSICLL